MRSFLIGSAQILSLSFIPALLGSLYAQDLDPVTIGCIGAFGLSLYLLIGRLPA